MTRLVLLEKVVDFNHEGLQVNRWMHVYEDRKRLATFEYDPQAPTFVKDIELARLDKYDEVAQ